MNWIPISEGPPPNGTDVWLCYITKRIGEPGKQAYDMGRYKDGKPFIIGRYFAWDVCEKVLAYATIVPYNPE